MPSSNPSTTKVLGGRVGGLRSWARTPDRTARTAPARRAGPGGLDYWLDRLDAERFADATDAQRVAAAESARRAHFAAMALKSAHATGWSTLASITFVGIVTGPPLPGRLSSLSGGWRIVAPFAADEAEHVGRWDPGTTTNLEAAQLAAVDQRVDGLPRYAEYGSRLGRIECGSANLDITGNGWRRRQRRTSGFSLPDHPAFVRGRGRPLRARHNANFHHCNLAARIVK